MKVRHRPKALVRYRLRPKATPVATTDSVPCASRREAVASHLPTALWASYGRR
ncbi:hypothetical protein [Nostoc sp.]|uniref:hypothetical protein n=1 Tax=Nostoc sp. TaxID=1180 RepID=UPI002FFACB43